MTSPGRDLRQSVFVEILIRARRTSKTLDACLLHDLEPTSDKFGAKHRCKVCGGEVDALHASWYRKGLEHARR